MRSALLLAFLGTALFSTQAAARNGGLYLELAPAWGLYSTSEVKIEKGDDTFSEFPIATFVPQLKAGVNLFGWAGAEAQIAGQFWDLQGDPGGGGYVGGVIRVTPLEVLSYILPDDVKVPSLFPKGPVVWKDRPFDLGFSMGGGYTLIGEDYAYQGGYFQWGFDIKWYVTPNFALGLDFPFRHLLYQPFRFANFNKRTGYCTDGGNGYTPSAAGDIPVPDHAGESFPQISSSDAETSCTKAAPAAFFFAPAFTIAGVFDFGI